MRFTTVVTIAVLFPFALPFSLSAQTTGAARRGTDNTYSGYNNFSSGSMRWAEKTIATLPTASGVTGKVFIVTDSTSATACTTGGGSTVAICRSNGSIWVAIGGGAAGGGDALVANPLSQFAPTTSAQFLGVISNETGSNKVVGSTTPTFDSHNLHTAIAAPATPSTGLGSFYVDSTSKNIAVKDDAGVVKHGVQTRTATANNWIRSIDDAGATTISQPAFTDLSGAAVDAQIPNLNVLGSGLTAFRCVETDGTGLLTVAAGVCGTAAGAPTDATYITQTPHASLSAEQALSVLATGCLSSTTTTGVAATRTLTGTANEITVTNGDCSGTPTFSLPAVIDLGGKTSLEIPNAAAPTVNVFGQIAGDNNLWASGRGAPVFYDGTAAVALVGVLVSDTPTNGQTLKWNTGGTMTWEDAASAGVSSIDTATGAILLGAGLSRASQTISFDSAVLSGVYAALAGSQTFGISNTFTPSSTTGSVVLTPSARPSAPAAGTPNVDLSGNFEWYTGSAWAAAGGAPVGATYLVQTANGTLTAEQALSSLSTGFMKVTTTTGAVTSVVPGTGVETFFTTPTGANFNAMVTSKRIEQNSKSAAYTTVLTDCGGSIYHPGADTTARTWTIDSNANVAAPIGCTISFVNDTSGGVITIAITSDTLVLAGAGTTGSRSLAANGIATATKVTSTRWIINGTGLT